MECTKYTKISTIENFLVYSSTMPYMYIHVGHEGSAVAAHSYQAEVDCSDRADRFEDGFDLPKKIGCV